MNCRYETVRRNFLKKRKVECIICQNKKKMNNSLRCEILLEILNKIFKKNPNNPDIRNNITIFIEEVCKNKGEECKTKPVLLHQVFSLCFGFLFRCLSHNLWLAVFYCHTPKSRMIYLIIGTEHS